MARAALHTLNRCVACHSSRLISGRVLLQPAAATLPLCQRRQGVSAWPLRRPVCVVRGSPTHASACFVVCGTLTLLPLAVATGRRRGAVTPPRSALSCRRCGEAAARQQCAASTSAPTNGAALSAAHQELL